jgi:exonuclease III
MIMGDFNIIPADVDMHSPGHSYHDTNASASEEERGWLDQFVEERFVDLFAHHYTQEQRRQGQTYTWWGNKSTYKRNKGWRIDHFYSPSQSP